MNLQGGIITGVYKLKKGDFAVIISVLCLWAVSFLPFLSHGGTESVYAVIYLDGEKYASYALNGIDKPKYITVEKFGKNVIEISKSGVRVTQSDCRDKFEIKGGIISKPNQSLICLPNRLVIKIEGGGESIDAVTY